MRVLITSCRFPADLKKDVQGTFRRFNLFMDAFKAIAQIDLLFYVPEGIDCSPAAIAQQQTALSAHWNTPVTLFLCPQYSYSQSKSSRAKWQQQLAPIINFKAQKTFLSTSGSKQLTALENCLARKPDAIFCHRLEAMTPILQTRQSLPPVFFDLDDIEHIAFARQIREPPTRLATKLYYLQIPALWWGERQSIRKALRTFVCSDLDRQYLAQRWKTKGVVSVPNAVSIPAAMPFCHKPALLFLGGYYYFPNLNAANFLIEQVWPLVYSARPDAKLIIAGTHPENIRSYGKAVPGVEFPGFVDDLDSLYDRVRIVCCPIFSGGGTRIKIIEAAAYEKAIVATKIGAEGLAMKAEKSYLQRNTAESFAQACVDLLDDQNLCRHLGDAARQAAMERYDRSAIVSEIKRHICSAIA